MEERLRAITAAFPYPATPDIAGRERRRLLQGRTSAPRRPNRLAFALALLLIIFTAAMLVSPVRARVLDWIRIGSVRIFFNPPTATPSPLPSGTPSPQVTPTLLPSALDLAGETTFELAQEQAGFPILLPAYPEDLDAPDHVFLQRFSVPVVILVWMDDAQPGKVRMLLSQSSSEHMVFQKYEPRRVEDVQMDGQPAVWLDGSYLLITGSGEGAMMRMIEQGHTLIWSSGEMTFRMETDADLEEAIRTAESIR